MNFIAKNGLGADISGNCIYDNKQPNNYTLNITAVESPNYNAWAITTHTPIDFQFKKIKKLNTSLDRKVWCDRDEQIIIRICSDHDFQNLWCSNRNILINDNRTMTPIKPHICENIKNIKKSFSFFIVEKERSASLENIWKHRKLLKFSMFLYVATNIKFGPFEC